MKDLLTAKRGPPGRHAAFLAIILVQKQSLNPTIPFDVLTRTLARLQISQGVLLHLLLLSYCSYIFLFLRLRASVGRAKR